MMDLDTHFTSEASCRVCLDTAACRIKLLYTRKKSVSRDITPIVEAPLLYKGRESQLRSTSEAPHYLRRAPPNT